VTEVSKARGALPPWTPRQGSALERIRFFQGSTNDKGGGVEGAGTDLVL